MIINKYASIIVTIFIMKEITCSTNSVQYTLTTKSVLTAGIKTHGECSENAGLPFLFDLDHEIKRERQW